MIEDSYSARLIRVAVRAYPVSDTELGSMIAGLARAGGLQLERIDHSQVSEDDKARISPMVTHVLPEIAARLMQRDGICVAHTRQSEISCVDAPTLRRRFAEIFMSDSFRSLTEVVMEKHAESDDILEIDLITAQSVNGNVALIGLDRLAPPSPKDDPLASRICLTGRLRGTPSPDGMWHPEMARGQIENHFFNDCAAQALNDPQGRAETACANAALQLALAM